MTVVNLILLGGESDPLARNWSLWRRDDPKELFDDESL
jgi:hypothetical protein